VGLTGLVAGHMISTQAASTKTVAFSQTLFLLLNLNAVQE
jgi:hypothetical protein